MRTDGQLERHDEANSRFSQLYESARKFRFLIACLIFSRIFAFLLVVVVVVVQLAASNYRKRRRVLLLELHSDKIKEHTLYLHVSEMKVRARKIAFYNGATDDTLALVARHTDKL